MKVTKMHALGNNYIYVNEFEEDLQNVNLPGLARTVSDVRKGIGSDGLILIRPSGRAEVGMRIFNADGSEAETCGNGLRCVAKYAYEHGLVQTQNFHIDTKAGVVGAQVHVDGDQVTSVTIDMGEAQFGTAVTHYVGPVGREHEVTVAAGDESVRGMLVSMGNPHFVSFVKDATRVPVDRLGPQIEQHRYFAERINVEFVSLRQRDELDFRVWERGSGITFACGTGACASVAAGVKKGLLDTRVLVHLLGGDLEIEVRDNRVYMTGEAVEVFTGTYELPLQHVGGSA